MIDPFNQDPKEKFAIEKGILKEAGFYIDPELNVLKMPFCKTPEEAKEMALGISQHIPRNPEDSNTEPQILLTTTGIGSDRTRSSAVIITLDPEDPTHDTVLIFKSGETSTLSTVRGFQNPDTGNKILRDEEAIIRATLEYIEQQRILREAQLAKLAIVSAPQ